MQKKAVISFLFAWKGHFTFFHRGKSSTPLDRKKTDVNVGSS